MNRAPPHYRCPRVEPCSPGPSVSSAAVDSRGGTSTPPTVTRGSRASPPGRHAVETQQLSREKEGRRPQQGRRHQHQKGGRLTGRERQRCTPASPPAGPYYRLLQPSTTASVSTQVGSNMSVREPAALPRVCRRPVPCTLRRTNARVNPLGIELVLTAFESR